MAEDRKDSESEISGLVGSPESDLVVDPAALEHLASDAGLAQSAVPEAGEALVLGLADLLPDVEGAVVMLTDDSLPVNLVTDEPLAGRGVVEAEVTAGGVDVEGLYYYSFANGVTLYSDTDIVILNETG